jgi:hypothetical protein
MKGYHALIVLFAVLAQLAMAEPVTITIEDPKPDSVQTSYIVPIKAVTDKPAVCDYTKGIPIGCSGSICAWVYSMEQTMGTEPNTTHAGLADFSQWQNMEKYKIVVRCANSSGNAVFFINTSAMHPEVARTVPATADLGKTFEVTYKALNTPSVWAASIADTISGGCKFENGKNSSMWVWLYGDGTEKTATISSPNKPAACKFSGEYRFGTEPAGILADRLVTISGPSCTPITCSDISKKCGYWSDGCGNQIICGRCAVGQTCNNGRCETPKLVQYQKKYENGTMHLFNIILEDIRIKVYERFSFIRNKISGSPSIKTEGEIKCSINRFRLIGGNISAEQINVTGTADLNCVIPVDVKITNEGIDANYKGKEAFKLRGMK